MSPREKLSKLPEERPPENKIWSLSELYHADLPPIEGALGGHIFTPQAVSLVVGDYGVGKTWLAKSLASSTALGRHWGHMPTKQQGTLILSEEITANEFQPRLKKLFSPKDIKSLDPVMSPRFRTGFRVEEDRDCDRMCDIINQTKAKWVVIYALRDITRLDENSNNEMSVVFRNIRDKIATPTHSHICLLHHTSKPNEFRKGSHRARGAVVMLDVSADVLVIDKMKDGSRAIVFDKTRHGQSPDPCGYRISNDPDDPGKVLFEIQSNVLPEEDHLFIAKKIKLAITEQGPLTREQIMKVLSVGKRLAEKYLSTACDAGIIINKSKSGVRGIYDVPGRQSDLTE